MTATKPSTPTSSSSSSSSSSSATPHTKNVFRLHGVNVLNRKNVDSIARLTALERRRATHILDERQRRDTMNQLLTELAGLVRESEMEAAQQPQQPQQPPPPPTPPTPTLQPDGTEKRPPVKSNSITTLRNAIAEIRRLRAHIGTQQQQQQQQQPRQPIHHHHEDPPSRRRSSASSTTPSLLDLDLTSLSTLAELASQHCSGSDSNPASYNSTPMSSPKSTSVRTLSPVASEAIGGGPSHHGGCGESPSEASSSSNQLYSPPLSPSSPTSIQNHFSITLPMMNPAFSDNGICSSSNRQTATLPPLHTIVQSTSLMYHSQQQPQHLSLSIGTHMQTQMELSPSSSSPGDPEVLSPAPYLQELLSIAQSPGSHTSNPPFPPL